MLKVKLPLKKESLLFRKSVFCLLYNTFSDQHFLFEYKTGFQNFIITLAKRIAFFVLANNLVVFCSLVKISIKSNNTNRVNYALSSEKFLVKTNTILEAFLIPLSVVVFAEEDVQIFRSDFSETVWKMLDVAFAVAVVVVMSAVHAATLGGCLAFEAGRYGAVVPARAVASRRAVI